MAPLLPQNTVMPENKNELTPIQEFYKNKSIFITGGTGFLGKILIEKLLRTCSDLESMFLLIRNKKGKNIHTRIDDIFEDPVFERLKQEQPKFRHKVFPIAGDCALPKLGIDADDRIKLQKTINIVFHVAATTRFDEHLKLALAINVQSTKEIVNLCRNIENLKAVIHVSTAYANCNRPEIEEKFYNTYITGENSLKLLDKLDEKTLDEITPLLSKGWPNTYTFTKCLAEDLVRSTSHKLPMGVFRPAIVIPSYKEPVNGWCDNMFGPVGVVVGVATGILRVMQIKKDLSADVVPVDMCVNSLITSAWEVASRDDKEVPIYNYVSAKTNPITWQDYCEFSYKHGSKLALLKSIWYYTLTFTSSVLLLSILRFFYHIVPALAMDAGLLIMGKKPKMVQIYRQVHRFTDVITYFQSTRWLFHDKNTMMLNEKLDSRDQKLFYSNMSTIDWDEYIEGSLRGIRKYLMKEDESSIPQALERTQRMKYLHYFTVYTIYTVVLYLLYKLLPKFFLHKI